MPVGDPIRDQLARDELNRLGLLYFIDVRATSRQVLEELTRQQRAAFAASVAERLMREHQAAPPVGCSPHVRAWRTALDAVWRGLRREEHGADAACRAVGRFYHGSDGWTRRDGDPADADHHTVMAVLYACECYLHGCLEFAMWSGWRGFDVATVRAAHDEAWPHRRPADVSAYAWELAHPLVQAELGQQLADLELTADNGRVLLDENANPGPLLDQLRTGGTPAA